MQLLGHVLSYQSKRPGGFKDWQVMGIRRGLPSAQIFLAKFSSVYRIRGRDGISRPMEEHESTILSTGRSLDVPGIWDDHHFAIE